MLKQVLLDHMIRGDAEETKDGEHSGAPGCPVNASVLGSPEGPSGVSDESRASGSLQKDDAPLSSEETALFETAERNGERTKG